MQRKVRLVAGTMAGIFFASLAFAPAALASEEGRRNTTLGLGALTGYLFTRRGNKLPAFIALGATAYSYKRYQDGINARHRRERRWRARHYYRAGYRRGYYAGRRHRR